MAVFVIERKSRRACTDSAGEAGVKPYSAIFGNDDGGGGRGKEKGGGEGNDQLTFSWLLIVRH